MYDDTSKTFYRRDAAHVRTMMDMARSIRVGLANVTHDLGTHTAISATDRLEDALEALHTEFHKRASA